MSDSTNTSTLDLAGLTTMGGANGYRVTGDRTSMGVSSVEALPTAPSQRGHSGSVDEPTMQPAMTADDAASEHTLLANKMADVDSKLSAAKFDPKTGKPVGFQIEGRERELLTLQRQSYQNAIDYLAVRAREQLPKLGAAKAAASQAELAAYNRELKIQALADSRGLDGRELGRVAATRMLDEAAAKDRADALVRGGR